MDEKNQEVHKTTLEIVLPLTVDMLDYVFPTKTKQLHQLKINSNKKSHFMNKNWANQGKHDLRSPTSALQLAITFRPHLVS